MPKKAIIVTGGSRGIGLETCRAILEMGFSVLATGRTQSSDALLEMQSSFQGKFCYLSVDQLDLEGSSKKIYNECIKSFGRIDGIVHSAGVLTPLGKLEHINIKQFQSLMDINLNAAIALIQVCLPELRLREGTITLVSSGASTKAYDTWGPYCMSKAALNMLASCLAVEEPQITTISIRPGVVDTDMQGVIRNQGQDFMPPALHDYFVALKRDGKLLDPSEPARVIADLAVNPRHQLSGQFHSWDKIEKI